MPKVVIVGAGIAGLTAALRLVERGFDVTIYEEDSFIGGKLGAHNHPDRPNDFHEHSYHMYLNWYLNFWQIMNEIGIRQHFTPQRYVSYIPRGQPRGVIRQTNVGSSRYLLQNAFAGLKPPTTMFTYYYSMVDLLSTPMRPRGDFDRWSVHGFLTSRPYMTEEATKLHGLTLVRAFSCPTFLSDARTYKHFESYSIADPDPMMWLLKGNSQQFLFDHFEAHLLKMVKRSRANGSDGALRIHLLSRVEKLHLENKRIAGLEIAELAASPTIDLSGPVAVKGRHYVPLEGDIVITIPPKALGRLIDSDVHSADPGLINVNRLKGMPMASFDVYFKRKIANVPKGVVLLLDSMHELSFLDTSQLWPCDPKNDVTSLNVILSDFQVFSQWNEREISLFKNHVLEDLKLYVEFNDDDIDYDRCHFQSNTEEELFINEVGSWDFRPDAVCEIPNLFIAGDYSQTPIDVVTVEGAVVSGLTAAECIRQRENLGPPIKILQPESSSEAMMAGMAYAAAPWAYAAKLTSEMYDLFKSRYQEIFPET
jgi:Flavin containing amine oxidoreductase